MFLFGLVDGIELKAVAHCIALLIYVLKPVDLGLQCTYSGEGAGKKSWRAYQA
jgi:hypothetical protein